MKKVIIIVLSVLIAAAIVALAVVGVLHHQKTQYFEGLEAELDSLFDQELVLTRVGDEEYDLTVENITSTSFHDIIFTIWFYDEDYELVDESFTSVTAWSVGKEVTLDFWTGKSFTTASLQFEYAESKYNTEVYSSCIDVTYQEESELHRELTDALEGVFDQNVVLNGIGGEEYTLTLRNNTGSDLKEVTYNLQFLDAKEKLVDEQESVIPVWNDGAQEELEIWEEASFSKVTLRLSYYGAENEQLIETEDHEIKCVNDAAVEIKLKNALPMKVDEKYDGLLYQTYTVQSFQYEESSWAGGECSCILKIAGNKTYDKDGSNHTDFIAIDWRLYDAKNNVVDSGYFQTESLKVNESYSIDDVYTEWLPSGTYYLELYRSNNS